MPKVLLVEDDNNLREIFQMRLQAEGYSTAVAADGEEGLVVAMKEKPDLIIADVMMPKLSGFEMVENLRSSPEMKDTKIIMMTALGQAEDQARGEKLGVVKYLVKSQVTLEDFASVVKQVLGPGDNNGAAAAPPAAPSTNTPSNTQGSEGTMDQSNNPTPAPGGDMPAGGDQPAAPADGATPAADGQQSSAQEQGSVQDQINNFAGGLTEPTATPDSGTSAPAMPAGDSGASAAPAGDTGAAPADANAPAMPPASEPPAASATPPADTGTPPSGDQGSAPTDPTANAL